VVIREATAVSPHGARIRAPRPLIIPGSSAVAIVTVMTTLVPSLSAVSVITVMSPVLGVFTVMSSVLGVFTVMSSVLGVFTVMSSVLGVFTVAAVTVVTLGSATRVPRVLLGAVLQAVLARAVAIA
jgi:hypothetical protein